MKCLLVCAISSNDMNPENAFDKYQADAMSVRLASADESYAVLGLPGEVGEICSLIAKAVRDGIPDEVEYNNKMKKELGDVLWFVAAIAHDNGFSLSSIADANINKLKSRKERGTLSGSGDDR